MAISRSENMRRIRSKDTAPEIAVRKLLRSLGYTGYRIHRKDLPGKPDVAFIGKRKAIFIHGCFWHGHSCKEGSRRPRSNPEYWLPKIAGNQRRDKLNTEELVHRSWSVLIVWECETKDEDALRDRLEIFVRSQK